MEKLAAAAQLLRYPDPTNVLKVLQLWVSKTPLHLVRGAILGLRDYDDRRRVAAATLDLISEYPNTHFGVPMLLYYASNADTLPATTADLRSLRTLVTDPVIPTSPALYANRIQAAVLRIPSQFDDVPTLPDAWIQNVFPDLPSGSLQFAGGRAFAWPAAVEAAMCMYNVGLTGQPIPAEQQVWLDAAGWQYAVDAGRLFRDALRERAAAR